MLEEDEGSYYLEFFSRSIGVSALLALFLAPIVPGTWAQYFLIFVVAVAAISGVVFVWVRGKFLKLAEEGDESSIVQTLISDDASTMFRVTGSTALILLVLVMWLGFAKLLWTFESFFVLFAALHLTASVVYTFLELMEIRGEIDDLRNCVFGTQSDNDGEETSSPERTE